MTEPPPPVFTKRSPLLPLQPQDPKPTPPRTREVRAVSMPGKTLTSRLIKPVGAALVLVALLRVAGAAASTVGAPHGGMPSAASDALITTSVAPFPCAATKGGVYVDTSCAEVCVCVTADAKWARSDTGVEGSATDCC